MLKKTNKYMRKYALFAIFLIMLCAPVMANVGQSCLDNTTLQTDIAVYDGSTWSNNSIYKPCADGCNNITSECNPNSYSSDSYWLYILLPVIAMYLLYLSNSLKEDDWAVHLMLLLISIIFIISTMAMVQIRTEALGMTGISVILTTLYWLLLIILIIVILYYFIKTITILVTKTGSKGGK